MKKIWASHEYKKRVSMAISKGRRGIKFTEEHRQNLSIARKKHKLSEEHKRNIGLALKGRKRPKEVIEKIRRANIGKHRSGEARERMSRAQKKRFMKEPSPMKGRHHSEETKKKWRETRKGTPPWNTGKKLSKKIRKILSEAHIGLNTGDKHPNWQGGKSFEPYGIAFNNKLKEQIRKRDNYTCQECHQTQKELGYKLPVHHIDYNKKNNQEDNLISLCRSCHAQTNFNRKDWMHYFVNKMFRVPA